MGLSLLNNRTQKRLAIEFRNDEVRFVEATVKQGQIQKILRMKQYPLPKDIKDGKINVEGLANTLKKWRKDNKWGSKNIHITIPSTNVIVRKQELPNLSISDLKEIVHQELGSTIHLPFENPIVDIVKIERPKSQEGKAKSKNKTSKSLFSKKKDKEENKEVEKPEEFDKCEVMIVAAPGDYINPLVAAVEMAGLKPLSIDIPALSLYRFIKPFDTTVNEQTILIVSINKEDVDIHIIDKGVLRLSRNVPMNIASYQKVNLEEEEEEHNGYERIYFNIEEHDHFDAYMADLYTELSRSVNFYERSVNSMSPVQKIFITGQSLPSEKLVNAMSERFTLPSQWVLSPPVNRKLSDENYIGFATVIGLVMKEVK